jgi:hypothetical protein
VLNKTPPDVRWPIAVSARLKLITKSLITALLANQSEVQQRAITITGNYENLNGSCRFCSGLNCCFLAKAKLEY